MSLFCSIVGNVDSGKSTFCENIKKKSKKLEKNITQDIIPHLYNNYGKNIVFLDTPGHECFNEMRIQTVQMSHIVLFFIDVHSFNESDKKYLTFLKEIKKPFVVILNKCDTMDKKQIKYQIDYFKLKLSENGFNSEHFKRNKNIKTDISIIPISALTKLGINNLFNYLEKIRNFIKFKNNKGYFIENRNFISKGLLTQAIISIPVKQYDVIHFIDNDLKLQTQSLDFIYDSKLKFVKNTDDMTCYYKLKQIPMPGTPFYFGDDSSKLEKFLKKLKKYTEDINANVSDQGIVIVAPTYTKLMAIKNYVNILKIRNKSVSVKKYILSNKILNKHLLINKCKQSENTIDNMYNQIYQKTLFFGKMKDTKDVFSSGNIYELFRKYINYAENIFNSITKQFPNLYAPCLMEILDEHIYHNKSPIILGVKIIKGKLHNNISIQTEKKFLGNIVSIQKDNKPIQIANENYSVCLKINSELKYESDMKFFKTFYTPDEKHIRQKYKWLFDQ